MRDSTRLIVILAAAIAATPAIAADLVVNGSFSTSVAWNGSGGGWSTEHIDGAGGWSSVGGNPGGMYMLNAGGQQEFDPTIRQTVTGLIAGAQYTLRGDYASNFLNDHPAEAPSLEVSLDSTVVFQGYPGPLGEWHSFTLTFTATASSEVLEIHAEVNGTDNDFKVDNFSILPVPCEPTIDQQPGDQSVELDASIVLSVVATSPNPMTYQWRRNGFNLLNGGRISGAKSATLSISHAEPSDGGEFTVVVTANGCSTTSDAATVLVICPSDYTRDGFVTGEDFDVFVQDFEYGLPAADVDHNTFVNGDDFDYFVEHFEAGC